MTLEQAIVKAVSEKTYITLEQMQSKSRKREIISARQIGYYLYKTVYDSATILEMCGKALFNQKQHYSTVIHAIAMAESHIKYERKTRMLIADIKERVDYLLREKDTTTPINQIIDGIKLGSINVVQAIPYNNCASF